MSDENKNNIDKITSHTPIKIEQFTIEDLFDSETLKLGVNAFITFLEQTTLNDQARNEISKKQLDNQLELKKFEIRSQEINLQANKNEYTHIKWLDIRNKVYTLLILVVIIISIIILKSYDILEKDEARTIIIIALTIGMTSNTDLIKKITGSKKND